MKYAEFGSLGDCSCEKLEDYRRAQVVLVLDETSFLILFPSTGLFFFIFIFQCLHLPSVEQGEAAGGQRTEGTANASTKFDVCP